jgi:hypothetical protein
MLNFPGLILHVIFFRNYQLPNHPHINPENGGSMFLRNVAPTTRRSNPENQCAPTKELTE